MKTISLELRPSDAEPILREAAEHAAKYSAWCDHITPRTVRSPHSSGLRQTTREALADARVEWHRKFLKAKRIVEAFGVEYEPTTEAETLGEQYIPDKVLKAKIINVAGLSMRRIDKSVPDPKNARPQYDSSVHAEACRQAADRVVRRWRVLLDVQDREPTVKALVVDTLGSFTLPCVTTREDGSPAFVDDNGDGEFAKGGLRW